MNPLPWRISGPNSSSSENWSLDSHESFVNPFAPSSSASVGTNESFVNPFAPSSSVGTNDDFTIITSSSDLSTAETPFPNSSATALYEEVWSNLQIPTEDLDNICRELNRLFYLSPDKDLPPSWPIEEFTRFILGEVDITPAYLLDVYVSLVECGFYSAYWEMAKDYVDLINLAPLY
jgi:hypothetical protein